MIRLGILVSSRTPRGQFVCIEPPSQQRLEQSSAKGRSEEILGKLIAGERDEVGKMDKAKEVWERGQKQFPDDAGLKEKLK